VDATGHARITDFGLATVIESLDSARSTSGGYDHAARWTAPEILSEKGIFSKEADIFSFAMIMVEVRYERVISLSFDSLPPRITTGIYRRSSVR